MVVIFKLHKTLIIHLNGSVFSILSKTDLKCKKRKFFMILQTTNTSQIFIVYLLLDFSLKLFWKFYHDFVL